MEHKIKNEKLNTPISESFSFAILLTLSGGFMDTYSYMCRDEVFANAQTGNLLLFGVNLSTGNFESASHYLFPVIAFVLGITAAEIIKHQFSKKTNIHWRQWILFMEALFLFSVAFMPQAFNLLANSLISFACGAQVQSFRTVNGSGVATTMCIGNLRSATQSLCDYVSTKNKISLNNSYLYFRIIGFFVIGAIIGNFCVNLWSEKAIIVSCVLLLAAFFLMLIKKEE